MIARIPFRALLALVLASSGLRASIVVPGANGSDGSLNITTNTVIDLSQANTGAWDASPTTIGKGVYDPSQWAVVFKYSSVNIAAGATVTFKNHPSRAPVVWLVNGDVVVAGTVSLDGNRGADFPNVAEPGPGGFRGGMVAWPAVGFGPGFGPGGGQRANPSNGNFYGASGSYGSKGGENNVPASEPYGNPSLIPLIGGSGGGAYLDRSVNDPGGGAGGGAMLIASTGIIRVNGAIRSTGGGGRTGSGSGGGIRLVSTSLEGAGTLSAIGGTGNNLSGGFGRIRIERVVNSNTIVPNPSASIVQMTDGSTALLWPPSTAPKVEVVSIGGVAAPSDPRASFTTDNPDIVVPETTTTTVIVRTTNVEQASQVKIRGTPRTNGNYSEVNATVSQVVTTSPLVILWTATVPVAAGHTNFIARVVRP